MSSSSSNSNSPCAACKFLRQKCTQECDLAPYFPADNPQLFACVHRVFGKSNVAKLLKELSAGQRDDAVKSLAYEAEARLRDPVYGCVGFISVLQQRLSQIQGQLHHAKKELATYLTPQAMHYLVNNNNNNNAFALFPNCPNNLLPLPAVMAGTHAGGGQLVMDDAQQQELLEAQQLAAAQQQQQQQQQLMLRGIEQQQEFLEQVGAGGSGLAPSLALGTFDNASGTYQNIQQQGEQQQQYDVPQHPPPVEAQLLLSLQQQQTQQSESEDGRTVGLSY